MPPRTRKTSQESLDEGKTNAAEIDDPGKSEIASLRADIEALIPMREEVSQIGATLDRLAARVPTVYDADGFVVGHTVLVENVFPGDIISVGLAGEHALPMIYRCIGDSLRNEFGITYPISRVPKPWRLLWRSPIHVLPVDKPKKAKKGDEETGDAEV
jgi:hypothetical protein